MILHFNRGTSDPDGDGHYDCIPAVDNFQLISGDEGLSWGPVTNISSFLQVRGYSVKIYSVVTSVFCRSTAVCCQVPALVTTSPMWTGSSSPATTAPRRGAMAGSSCTSATMEVEEYM